LRWIKAERRQARHRGAMIEGIKDIFVGLTRGDDAPAEEPALAYGLSLAAAASAAVTVQSASLHAELHSTWVTRFAAGLVGTENERRRSLAKAMAVHASSQAAATGVSCTTFTPHLNYAALLASFAEGARLHDLTVYGAEPEALSHERGVIETLLTGSGRPLIVVPPGHRAFAGKRVLIAWDGSDRAARAANDALPLLRAAEAVEIVTVEGEKQIAACGMGARFVPHLARHGVAARARCLGVRDNDVAASLRAEASEFAADLIVMGGYVHNRTRELLFGGVTQSLLGRSDCALFMSY
jgi:nucleotide-binding universal stress UspA family protein